MLNKHRLAAFVMALLAFACQPKKEEIKTIGSIERIDPALDQIIAPDAKIEILDSGYVWSEGPVWVESQKMLLFSDVPKNTIYKWTEETGAEPYLTPSGYTGAKERGGEPGSNGLTLDDKGNLILAQHGDRRIARMNAPLSQPKADFVTISDNHQGKKLNSPNDVVYHASGAFFFTDPPYGLLKNVADSSKEIPFQGVYRVSAKGLTTLMTDSLTRPNGIAFSPDGKKMYVANSDPDKARWYEYTLNDSMKIASGRIFFDATSEAKSEKGLPDGMKVDANGNVFGSGPGGLWIFSPDGKLLGKIKIPEATANCAFSPDYKTLYVTSDMYILRVKLR